MEIRDEVFINAPIKKVLETFTNITCWTNWNTVMTDISSDENSLINSKSIKCNFRAFLFPIKLKIELEEVSKYKKVVWSTKKTGLIAQHEFTFKKNKKGVIVKSKEIFSGLLAKSYFVLTQKKIKNITSTFLQDLKKASEKNLTNNSSLG